MQVHSQYNSCIYVHVCIWLKMCQMLKYFTVCKTCASVYTSVSGVMLCSETLSTNKHKNVYILAAVSSMMLVIWMLFLALSYSPIFWGVTWLSYHGFFSIFYTMYSNHLSIATKKSTVAWKTIWYTLHSIKYIHVHHSCVPVYATVYKIWIKGKVQYWWQI